jgi:hypothetical protein
VCWCRGQGVVSSVEVRVSRSESSVKGGQASQARQQRGAESGAESGVGKG